MTLIFLFFIAAIIYSLFAQKDQKKRAKKLPMNAITEQEFQQLSITEKEKIFEAYHEWNTSGNVYKVFDFHVVCEKKYGKIIDIITFKEWEEKIKNERREQKIKPITFKVNNYNSEQIEIEKDNWINQKISYLNSKLASTELRRQKNHNDIGYSDLLNCFEWQFTRLKILIRDNFKCKTCGCVSESNHIHHKYYIKDRLPWEIEESALETQCQICHRKIHENNKIKVYEEIEKHLVESNNLDIFCSRCSGSGYIHQYKHVQNGICFKCYGNCIDRTLFSNRVEKINLFNSLIRREYYSFFSTISIDTYINKIKPAFLNKLNTNEIKPINDPLDALDDLPF